MLISPCNSRSEVKDESSGGSGALEKPAIDVIKFKKIELENVDIEEKNTS